MRMENSFFSDDVELDYCGPAIFTVGGEEINARVVLRGFFQPIDGTYRWHGRVSADAPVLAQLAGARSPGVIHTPHGRVAMTLDEVDLWGRYRVRGTGRPPFPIDTNPRGWDELHCSTSDGYHRGSAP
ncbi:DUF4873 domain-containing protein [Mycobacteroides abscessus]|uniref:DUF4873 domain-containing protein n=1 Tax=Mycobacteroides abscessus TaxID=36809 RepID=UPI0009266D88|nr:DUF4873 domain-containing protein [Mycobacteroides abscessus]SHP46240.1 Uncharacterised protein [Mycobacteroides abscessus subsp. abscessus]SHP52628.1 Uncharacterised protein [Mycobacteroides abscessus subsp. abscessus]SHP71165.1 Uncharacterised protein [Mycobacteroides abscessus subsp. abscessus]SHQ27353.1 Uncharacterised protein [Mycobacteroides abscessus subsp. abscessus]SHR09218.1 Uncharacterised protein [Mycobacteroides abscessus subsp. abscessus]